MKFHNEIINGNKITLTGRCVFTGEPYSVEAPLEAYENWKYGNELIQNALPMLSADDREFLISGISPKGWKQTFGEE